MGPPGARSGLALLIVVGVLGLLAMLATAFVTMAQLERRASMQRLHATKAVLLARSGIEDALARLSAGQDPGLPGSRYGGENWDGDPLAELTDYEKAQQVFNPANPSADVETCPVRHAMRPSFHVRMSPLNDDPDLVGVDGRQRGYSGRLAGDRGTQGNVYGLKVDDESAKINVNGGFLDALNRDDDIFPDYRDPDIRVNPADPKDTGLGWNFQLARILDILGNQPEVDVPDLGTRVIQNRPEGGYRAIAQLQAALNTTQDLSPWLTVASWADTKVVHPNGYPAQPGATSLSLVKRNRRALCLEEAGRPPVNLNAAPRPLLVALLDGLSGKTWQHPLYPQTHTIPTPMARKIADALIAFRRGQDPDGIFLQAGLTPGPFDSWSRFSAFCDALVPSVIKGMNVPSNVGGGNLCGADLLKANFDPNSASNKELPDQIKWRWIDKTDLSVWSTEGSFAPTGTFRVSCVGRVLGPDGRLLARAEASSTLEAFSLLRQTSQEDFLAGRRPDDSDTSCLSLAENPLEPGSSTTFASAKVPWKTWNAPEGLAVVTYPNPPGAAAKGLAAEYDGWLALATVEMDTAASELRFLHHFDDGWDADRGKDTARKSDGPNDSQLQTEAVWPVWPDPELPWPGSLPSTLYPDGMHGQLYRAPAYQALDNLPPPTFDSGTGYYAIHGVLSYWVKPMNYYHDTSVDDSYPIDFSCVRWGGNKTQAVFIGRRGGNWGCLVERWAADGMYDAGHERVRSRKGNGADVVLPGLRWELATAFWDTAVQDGTRDVRLACLGMLPYAGEDEFYAPYSPDLGEDLAPDGNVLMVMGGQGLESGFGARHYDNQVIDEFAVLDFGPDAEIAFPAHEDWVARRYQHGRYHKGKAGGDQGAFLSEVLGPEPGREVRLLNARWTGYLPRESREDLVVRYGSGRPPAQGTPRPVDPVLADPDGAPHLWIEVQLMDKNGTLTSAPLRRLGQGTPINLALPGFRYRVNFVNDIPDEDLRNNPILETPFFDDITFAWQRSGGPRVLAWGAP